MWINNISDPENPLFTGQPDPPPESAEFYGYDPHGPTPIIDSDNNVVVPPIDIENATELQSAILDVVDPLAASNEMGIDIYEEVLTFLRNMTNAS